jgi:hypothetical protein
MENIHDGKVDSGVDLEEIPKKLCSMSAKSEIQDINFKSGFIFDLEI